MVKKQEFIEKMKEANIKVSQVHNRNNINSCVIDYFSFLCNITSKKIIHLLKD